MSIKKCLFLIIILAYPGFVLPQDAVDKPLPLNEKLAQYHVDNFERFLAEFQTFVSLTKARSAGLNEIQRAFNRVRLHYKQIEYALDFYYTRYNQMYVNGTPFEKYDYESSGEILESQGLQRLDELIYLEEFPGNRREIRRITEVLSKKLSELRLIYPSTEFDMATSIEAIRLGLVRIFALGLTAFDTPGSPNALTESHAAFNAMSDHLSLMAGHVKPHARDSFTSAQELFYRGDQFFRRQKSFNDFDRLSFLKKIINPLYKQLLTFQLAQLGTVKPLKEHAQNLMADNLFAGNFLTPAYFCQYSLVPLNNGASVELGEMLFSDTSLSRDHKMSCATCHQPEKAFTDGLATSQSNKPGVFQKRNSPSLINAIFSTRQFWDMRAYDLERQVVHVVDNELEFDTTFEEIIRRLSVSPAYVKRFEEIYGGYFDKPVQPRTVSNALAAYVASLQSFNSRFDRYVRNEIDELPAEVGRGFNLFMGKGGCGACHFAPVFNGTVPPFYTDTDSEVLGVTVGFDPESPVLDADPGRADNRVPRDQKVSRFNRAFKTMTVRNAELTAPYMHNGSFKTLEEVIDFYDRGGGKGLGLDVKNQTLPEEPLDLTGQEKQDIIAFINALTDPSIKEAH